MGMIKHFTMSIEELILAGVPAEDAVAKLVAEYQLDEQSDFVRQLYTIYAPSSDGPPVSSTTKLH